jgi:hypothetical protein
VKRVWYYELFRNCEHYKGQILPLPIFGRPSNICSIGTPEDMRLRLLHLLRLQGAASYLLPLGQRHCGCMSAAHQNGPKVRLCRPLIAQLIHRLAYDSTNDERTLGPGPVFLARSWGCMTMPLRAPGFGAAIGGGRQSTEIRDALWLWLLAVLLPPAAIAAAAAPEGRRRKKNESDVYLSDDKSGRYK